MKSRFDDQICPCCGGSTFCEWGSIGFRRDGSGPVMIVCLSFECQQLARKVYAMDDAKYNEIKAEAIWEGGCAGGAYLDAQGLSMRPFGELTEEQYFSYLQVVDEGKETALKRLIKDWADTTSGGENG